ncbi:FIG00897050: hypothetical protein [hydrothermal vent metagenome]|uniref:Fido domain-containing protein n=1 Tax=hydrothermal vent metagenome TaxID=652676 RepID=A0A3B0TTI4_9ZZZZ
MATPSEKLAGSLELLKKLQNEKGLAVIHANEMSRTHKTRLVENGFLKKVLKGWYIATKPEERDGDTTSWYMSFWYFISKYLNTRFNGEWCLSPEQSLSIHSGNHAVPNQLLVRSLKAQNNVVSLLHNTSILDLKSAIPDKNERIETNGLQIYSLAAGLLNCSPNYFVDNPTDSRTCLSMVKSSSKILSLLLQGGHSVKAGRLAGAFRNIGSIRIADEILNTMKSVGYDVREADPFVEKSPFVLKQRETSPYVTRIGLMWHQMRQVVLENFPKPGGMPNDHNAFLKQIEETYKFDAYHSLSIEGYRVTMDLIEKVRIGEWNPKEDASDKQQKDVMAARGYWQAFQKVKENIKEVLEGRNSGEVVDEAHGVWFTELFAPSVAAGILKTTDLAGYRNSPVYIKGSKHVPPGANAVYDTMPALFDLLRVEDSPAVRAVLGHFIFAYIHPYMDGNGRISRFLMNVMLASGGFNWTIIPVERRDEYMTALEQASVRLDILPFTRFIRSLL